MCVTYMICINDFISKMFESFYCLVGDGLLNQGSNRVIIGFTILFFNKIMLLEQTSNTFQTHLAFVYILQKF